MGLFLDQQDTHALFSQFLEQRQHLGHGERRQAQRRLVRDQDRAVAG